MPCPTDDLRADHAVVEVGLAVLAAIAAHVRAGRPFPADDAATTLRFLREFVVGTHFRKENEVVWPAMALRGSGGNASAIGQLMRAQEEVRELVSCLVLFWEPVGELTAAEREGFGDTVDALRRRLQRMRHTEERLFVGCQTAVPPDDQIDWAPQFAEIETQRASRAEWHRQLRELTATWN